MNSGNPQTNKLLAALQARRAAQEAAKLKEMAQREQEQKHLLTVPIEPSQLTDQPIEEHESASNLGRAINLNERQKLAVQMALEGKSFCLIGAAGTGKTTTIEAIAIALMEKLGSDLNSESIIFCAFTNRAVRNIQAVLRKINAEQYAKTIHKWLEYSPEWYDVYDAATGTFKKTMRFEPRRHAGNPILDAQVVKIDEASMVDPELHQKLVDACPNATFIYVGDINQIPPVFGMPILGYKLNELPVVELIHIYRQAMDSPIIAFQHNYTLKGKLPSDSELQQLTKQWGEKGLSFLPFKTENPDLYIMAEAVAYHMFKNYKNGIYDPTLDTILIPYNKSFGSIHINLHLANLLGKDRNAVVHEIKSGFQTMYLAEGDFVMYNKREFFVTKIEINEKYFGDLPQPASNKLNRFGILMNADGSESGAISAIHVKGPSNILELTSGEALTEVDDILRQASHIVTLSEVDTGEPLVLSSSGELNALEFGYAMTVHKSQGSEWRKVWFILCRQHKAMLSREILYTGMTRAREHLTMIYTAQTTPGKRNNSIARAIANPRFPGTTWQEKAKRFQVK